MPMPRSGALAALMLCCFWPGRLAGQQAPAKDQTLPTLTTAEAVHRLSPAEASRHYPVHLQSVCVICYPGWHGLFVHDGATGVYVETKNQVLLTPAIHTGSLLDIQGVTGSGEFAPIVDQSILRVLGEAPLPPARPVSLDRLSTGIEDGQWISLVGTVRSAETQDDMLALVVASGQMQVEVKLLRDQAGGFGGLIDARVQVDGTVGPVFDQRHQLVGNGIVQDALDAFALTILVLMVQSSPRCVRQVWIYSRNQTTL